MLYISEMSFEHMKSQEEVNQLLYSFLKNKEKLSFKEFQGLTEKLCSDMFLCVCILLFIGLSLSSKQIYALLSD